MCDLRENCCSVCLKTEENMKIIYFVAIEEKKVSEILEEFFNIEINSDNEMINKICNCCQNKIIAAVELKSMINHSQQQISEWVRKRKEIITIYQEEQIDIKDGDSNVRTEMGAVKLEIDFEMTTNPKCIPKEEIKDEFESPEVSNDDADSQLKKTRKISKKAHNFLKNITTKVKQPKFENPFNPDDQFYILRKHVCHICSRRFQKYSFLEYHLKVHKNIRPFKCNEKNCNKAFVTVARLERHKNEHNTPKVFCPKCSKTLVNQSSLRIHLRRHAKDFSYLCPQCEKGFYKRSELKRHLPSHRKKIIESQNLISKVE